VAKASPTGVCRLCTNTRALMESHVSPEFLYQDVYDPKHRFVMVPTAEKAKKAQYEQKGLRERLLCRSCEGRLSGYETYSAPIVRRMEASTMPTLAAGPTVISGVDYDKFKLFLMSHCVSSMRSSRRDNWCRFFLR
jgi:hypothetical protein